jgi:hypothetical protein
MVLAKAIHFGKGKSKYFVDILMMSSKLSRPEECQDISAHEIFNLFFGDGHELSMCLRDTL